MSKVPWISHVQISLCIEVEAQEWKREIQPTISCYTVFLSLKLSFANEMWFTHFMGPLFTVQGGPSGRGLAYVDFQFGVAFQYKNFILGRNFEFDVNIS